VETADLLTGPDAVLACVKASGKKALLAELASRAAVQFKLDERRLFDRLLERERLGSTGIGGGIAIPHGRMAGITAPLGMFARLAQPIDFDSIDERPVDIVFLLIAPEGAGADHLKALARGGHRLAVGGEDADRMRAIRQVDRLDVGDLLCTQVEERLVRERLEDAVGLHGLVLRGFVAVFHHTLLHDLTAVRPAVR
jgi:PTS system nitrogen regulatory IIA component